MSNRSRTPHTHHIEGQCDNFMAQLCKRDRCMNNAVNKRPVSGSKKPDRGGGGSKQGSTSTVNQLQRLKSGVRQQQNLDLARPTKHTSVVHKESLSDTSALVEVTVKAKKKAKSRSDSPSEAQPWDQILRGSVGKEKSSMFNNFDPLRTIHFLAKELKFKLQNAAPDDNNLLQMISDMQQALKRVPPEVASQIHLHRLSSEERRNSKKTPSGHLLTDEQPEKLIQVIKPSLSEKTSQTPHETERIHKLMEDSTQKLEASCRQMEMLCGRLKSEKDELEVELKSEKESVGFLKKRVDYLENQNDKLLNIELKKLQETKVTLEVQMESLKKRLEIQEAESAAEQKLKVDELQIEKGNLEEECSNVKRELAISRLEKEKYLALLALRDQQILEIKSEMDQLQQVITEQLRDLNSNVITVVPSADSLGTNPSDGWLLDPKESARRPSHNYPTHLKENDPNLQMLRKAPSSCKEFPSGDSGMIQDILDNGLTPTSGSSQKSEQQTNRGTSGNRMYPLPDNPHTSIRDMFMEVKNQAYSVVSSPDQTGSHARYPTNRLQQ